MRTRQLIPGLSNNQKIRLIVDGVAFHTVVKGVSDLAYYRHRLAAIQALVALVSSRRNNTDKDLPVGYATRYEIWQDNGYQSVDIQVDLY